ncbi:MAG: DEAD/DEAH box helicase [Gammaproteobacteria bacterium]|nr:DEAD/DEAH box helicase [Gammaproteobacteria bacterium]
MNFTTLGLSPAILQTLTEKGYQSPTPIQLQAIPAILAGNDVMAAAQTGTGKTAGFTLPLIERLSKGPRAPANHVRALILTPTRELAAQVSASVSAYAGNLALSSAVVFGGVKINPQMMALRKGVDIMVATPGRLLDLYQQNAIKFGQLEVLVLDEADRMLDMGFITDIKKILKLLPVQRQNLMFSATFSADIRQLAKSLVTNPVEISVTPRNATAPTVEQWVYPVDKKKKSALLLYLIKHHQWQQVLVFCKTKQGANRLTRLLDEDGIKAAPIHGNKSQAARTRALNSFKDASVQILVATDIAARGLDINQLPHVINFDLPTVAEDYVHRIGRTGRAGSNGQAISLVSADEFDQLAAIERLTQKLLKRKLIDGFEPVHSLPESRLGKPLKAKKPKKPKKAKINPRNAQPVNDKTQGRKKDSRQADLSKSKSRNSADAKTLAKKKQRTRTPSKKTPGTSFNARKRSAVTDKK